MFRPIKTSDLILIMIRYLCDCLRTRGACNEPINMVSLRCVA